MDDINTIYYNDFGIAFQWKRTAAKDFNKIQLVFKNTGLFLNKMELVQFLKNIEQALMKSKTLAKSSSSKACELVLLEAPNPQISFAMVESELKSIQDLITRTLFQLGLHTFLNENQIRFNGY
ncbi:hypothetical protein JJL45_04300 [Tamlana sp. s12]|uniref:hypothetical protein n=1 Tax=Tamlana sp. s12 TaxID=1630406 RepID=UPI0007FC5F3C|nr:hypothetical protein [Tamlana sp. s12]OBQ55109.1 hypothetical protein VQ01_10285 [Tamlana sp. s12]QQY83220.1 hypothetical protein JJL45_04300 [Tamlana sp. s12]